MRRCRCLPVGAIAWIANRQAPESLPLRASLFDATDNGFIRFPRPSTSELSMAESALSETFEEVHIVTSFHCVSQSQVHSVNFLLGLHALGVLAAAYLTQTGVFAPSSAVSDSHGTEERFSRVSARLSHWCEVRCTELLEEKWTSVTSVLVASSGSIGLHADGRTAYASDVLPHSTSDDCCDERNDDNSLKLSNRSWSRRRRVLFLPVAGPTPSAFFD